MSRLDGAWTVTGGGAGELGIVVSGGSLDCDVRRGEVTQEPCVSIVAATDETSGEVELRGVRTAGAFGSEVVEHYRVEIRSQDGRDTLSLTEIGESRPARCRWTRRPERRAHDPTRARPRICGSADLEIADDQTQQRLSAST